MNTQLNLFQDIEDLSFIAYHENNPQIFKAFERKTLEAIDRGFVHYGSKGIFELLRWESSISGDDGFKINNIYTPLYSRLFENKHPHLKGFFRMRKSKFEEVEI